jgi:aminoglycoside phosphotransferase (APT) family kinase protein
VSDLQRLLGDDLAAYWSEPVRIGGLTRLTGGASRETWSFTAERASGERHELIVRRDQGGARAKDLRKEAAAFRAAARVGVPVPAQHVAAADRLIMDRVDGESLGRRVLREDRFATVRAGFAAEIGAIAARLHTIPAADMGELEDAGDPLDWMRRSLADHVEVSPALALAMRWLREHPVPAGPTGVVHGDFRFGNLLLAPDRVSAVLDWERVHLGDPLEDLGWLCTKVWRFGGPLPVAGMGSREDLLDAYAAVAGWRPTERQLHWWELYAAVQWGLICGRQADRHLSGQESSVELAVIGRRRCEQDHDVLLALGLTEPTTEPDVLDDPPPAPDNAPHGRPDTIELLAAAGEFLTGLVDEPAVTEAALRYHARVAANALRIARRQLLLGERQRAEHRARLADLGCTDDAALVAAIWAGTLDDRWDGVVAAIRASVRDQLRVANPRHLRLGP